jgi:ubiquinone/menaquinone biosynthesis C-methylase UbiE
MSSDHVDQIRNQFTRQAQAYADTAQAKDDDAHSKLVALLAPAPTARVLDVACGPGCRKWRASSAVAGGSWSPTS